MLENPDVSVMPDISKRALFPHAATTMVAAYFFLFLKIYEEPLVGHCRALLYSRAQLCWGRGK